MFIQLGIQTFNYDYHVHVCVFDFRYTFKMIHFVKYSVLLNFPSSDIRDSMTFKCYMIH